MYVVVQTRKVLQWHSNPVTGSVCPPATMKIIPCWWATWLTDSDAAEETVPMRNATLSWSMSLWAFCAERPALLALSSMTS